MPLLEIQLPRSRRLFEEGFARIREELGVPEAFPEPVEHHAAQRAASGPAPPPGVAGERRDARGLELLTIDPPGSRDLDQAFHAETRPGGGFRVHYAIADVAAFVAPGDPVDVESLARGVTVYSPDSRSPLHPRVLSEGRASLLPGQDTPALLWTLDLDARGALGDARLERAVVRSRRARSYREVQDDLDAGRGESCLARLAEIGGLRDALERERDGVHLDSPSQEVVPEGEGYRLRYESGVPVEGWNAQISLLSGMAAARIMLEAGVGLLRTLPPPDRETLEELRLAARGLGIDWPSPLSYAGFVRGLDGGRPSHAAMLAQAARGLRGAGYLAFDGERPHQPGHAAVAAPYAHVTAPLRRVCDRFANEIVLAACAGRRPPAWALEALPELPKVMGAARRRARALERAAVDFVEAVVLSSRVGEVFPALVTHVDPRGARLQLREPAVRARVRDRRLAGELALGREVPARLAAVDLEKRRVRFEID